jgi:hypothetical protein
MSDINNNQNNNTLSRQASGSFQLDNTAISPERYIFWLDDLSVLYKNNGYTQFVPTSNMTRVEQLNALTRFFLYTIIIFYILGEPNEWMYIPIIGIIFCIVLYNVFEVDEKGKKEELIRMKRKIIVERMENEELQYPDVNYRIYQVNDDGEIVTKDIDRDQKQNDLESASLPGSSDHDIEAGYYDSDGKLQYGQYNDPFTAKPTDDIKYTLDEIRAYERAKCKKPTLDNPSMNQSLDDFNKEAVPVACNADIPDIAKDQELKFNASIYRDIEDVFDNKNSQRQFFTVPHNIPNDQEAFARWCYKFPTTCKTDQERCLRYEDLRTKY